MLSAVFGVLLACGLANAGTPQQSNQYVDTLLFNTLPGELRVNRQEPLALVNFNTEFKDKLLMVSVNVATNYTKGNLTGLSRLSRARDCSGTALIAGQYRINCTFAFSNLHLDYSGNTKYGKVPSISIKASANIQTVYLAVEIASLNRGQQPFLSKNQITSGIDFTTQFTGLGPASSFLKGLQNSFKDQAVNLIQNAILGHFTPSLDRVVRRTTMPI